jgi:branched-subunit amino acid transport protein
VNVWLAILVAALVSYGIRVLPLTLIRRPIRSVFLRSFLYYVPFVTLAVMTFPAIVLATDKLAAGVAALLVGVVIAWRKGSLVTVAAACCAVVFLLECVL